jgi:hypothetical protein
MGTQVGAQRLHASRAAPPHAALQKRTHERTRRPALPLSSLPTSLAGRWYRDPSLPIQRNEITRFPHAVLEVKLSLNEGQSAPSWVQELLDSGYLTEVGGRGGCGGGYGGV